MNMKRIFGFMILLAMVGMVSAGGPDDNDNRQSGMVISGIVEDGLSGESLTGVKVAVEGTDLVSYTDFSGAFAIGGIGPGQYDLTIEMISYEKKNLKGIEVIAGDEEKLTVTLDPSSPGLSERSN